MTTPVEVSGGDELSALQTTFNDMLAMAQQSIASYNGTRARLAELIGAIGATASTVTAASQEIAASAAESGRGAGEIATAITELARGSERQVQAVGAAQAVSNEALATAADGRSTATEMVTVMEHLDERSKKIDGFVQTVAGIAEQTNLLALDAAIEAARAGDHGRGFAVVAEEVRKLAEEAQRAAGEISCMVEQIQSASSDAVQIVEERAVGAFAAIAHSIESLHGGLSEVVAIAEVASAKLRAGLRRGAGGERLGGGDRGDHERARALRRAAPGARRAVPHLSRDGLRLTATRSPAPSARASARAARGSARAAG